MCLHIAYHKDDRCVANLRTFLEHELGLTVFTLESTARLVDSVVPMYSRSFAKTRHPRNHIVMIRNTLTLPGPEWAPRAVPSIVIWKDADCHSLTHSKLLQAKQELQLLVPRLPRQEIERLRKTA